MNARIFQIGLGGLLAGLLVGCASTPPYDYTNYRAHLPRSIFVLPPLNESPAVEATYGFYSIVTQPLAELGYYVYPVVVVDHFLKENGLPTAGEMHQIPLNKIDEIVGADAVLYITVLQYGTKYQLINSATIVRASAKLVDVKTGLTLWEGVAAVQENSGGSGNLIADAIVAAISQAVNTSTDHAHAVSRTASYQLVRVGGHPMLCGPRHPEFGKENTK